MHYPEKKMDIILDRQGQGANSDSLSTVHPEHSGPGSEFVCLK